MRYLKYLLMMFIAVILLSCSDSFIQMTIDNQNDDTDNQSANSDPQADSGTPSKEGDGDDKSGTQQGESSKPRPSGQCDSNEKMCNGICKDILSSVKDCGDCDHACNPTEKCSMGKCEGCTDSLCGTLCTDLKTDIYNCGSCDNVCKMNQTCTDGACGCKKDYLDCNKDPNDGCEAYLSCSCTIGETQEVYDEDIFPNTKNVGECKPGKLECKEDAYGVPRFETVYSAITPEQYDGVKFKDPSKDYDCNGIPDGDEDRDEDGYTINQGDCCDSTHICGANDPEFINPGMIEIPENDTDDNCDGQKDEKDDSISNADKNPLPFTYNSSDLDATAKAMAQAMGIVWNCDDQETCDFGLIEAKLTRSESDEKPNPMQVNIMEALQNSEGKARVLPRQGKTFIAMSSGQALDVHSNVNAADQKLETYKKEETKPADASHPSPIAQREAPYSKIPAIYLENHDDQLATHESCPADDRIKPSIHDSVQFHVKLKTPKNVKGISFDFRFFTREYAKYICSPFNDFFLALLTTKHEGLKDYPDHNIAFDENQNPISVNNAFFTSCAKIQCSTDTDCPAFMHCSDHACVNRDDESLTCKNGGTVIDAYYPNAFNGYDKDNTKGGGTAWLTTTAPVVGGEIIELDFYIWDTQDNEFDSTVLIDNFKWLLDDTIVNTGFAVHDESNPNPDDIN